MKKIILYSQYLSVRLFFILFFLLIIGGGYFFSVPQISFGNHTFTNQYYEFTKLLPTWFYFVKYLTIVFSASFVLILFLIVFYILHKKRKEIIHDKYFESFVVNLFQYLYEEDFSDEERRNKLKTIKDSLKNDTAKRIFLNVLRRVHLQTQGEVRERNFKLLKVLHFNSFIRAYLHSPYLRHKLFALRIISDLQLHGYEDYIFQLTKRNSNLLRSDALVAIIKLYLYDDHLFMVDFNVSLALWDVNMIINKVQQDNNKDIDYLKLITSEIPEMSTLGIILARLAKRIDLKLAIKQKIGDPNNLLNEEAFLAFISFAKEQSDYDFLIDNFDLASEKAQMLILQEIGHHQNEIEKTKFYAMVVENKPLKHKIEAIRLLLKFNLCDIIQYQNADNQLIRQACLQVLDMNK